MKSFLGWLILLAALAVPAVLFWNWWQEMQGPAAAENAVAAPPVFAAQDAAAAPAAPEGGSPSPPAAGAQAPQEPASGAPATAPRAGPARRAGGFNPRSSRDPMLSLVEIQHMAERRRLEEEARRRALEASRPQPQAPQPSACSRITLQGIVTTPNGAGAIINDEVRYVGDKVLGARVTRITGTRVILSDRGRLCIKKVGPGG